MLNNHSVLPWVLVTSTAWGQSSGIRTYANPVDVDYRYNFEHHHVGAAHLAVGDIRVFGNGDGRPPATPRDLTARRDSDRRNAFIGWSRVPGAVGNSPQQPSTRRTRSSPIAQRPWSFAR